MNFAKHCVRQMLRLVGICLYQTGFARLIIRCSKRPRVVLYHAVENRRSSFTDGLGVTVSPQTLERQLDYYQRYYTVLGMNEYLRESSTQHQAPLLITFDDGYASVMENALPLLEARGMSATVYIIGNAVRGRMVWVNRLNQAMNVSPAKTREVLSVYPQCKQLGRRQLIHYIQSHFEPAQITALIDQLESTVPELAADNEKLFSTAADIRQMHRRGFEFGFHSNDHWNLSRCRDSELASTLSTDGIENLITSKTFAYPFGYFAPSAIGQLTRQGYQKLMTVGCCSQRFSALHMTRTEMFEPGFARMFARLEIEEPAITALRGLFRRSEDLSKQLTQRLVVFVGGPVGEQ